jgi:RNA polymerase sigma factor (sigma-70 family)
MSIVKSRSSDFEEGKIVGEFLPYIRWVSYQLSNRLPSWLSAEDLIQEGCVALLERFRESEDRGEIFRKLARQKIRWVLLDKIRSAKPGRRSPSNAQHMDVTCRIQREFRDDFLEEADPRPNPEIILETKQVLDMAEDMRCQLPEPFRMVTCFRFSWDMTFEKAGELMKLSRMRACQLFQEAMEMLKIRMNAKLVQNISDFR